MRHFRRQRSARDHRTIRYLPKPVFAAWLGDDGGADAELDAAGIPNFGAETDAVRSFMYLVRYREGQEALMATPPSLPADFAPDIARAREIVAAQQAANSAADSSTTVQASSDRREYRPPAPDRI
jgi:acyl-CoA synthetase (NDP forming)